MAACPSGPNRDPRLTLSRLGRCADSGGEGLAVEGALAVVEAPFRELEVERLISLIDRANPRAAAVARRLGMRPETSIREPDTGAELRVYAISPPGPP